MVEVHIPQEKTEVTSHTKPTSIPFNFRARVRGRIEAWANRYFTYWHGGGFDGDQWRYYRCEGCHGLVTWNTIKIGGCLCGMSNKMRPAALTRREKVKLLVMPWSV